jgi:3-hydroxybutyrate dehydrogenase
MSVAWQGKRHVVVVGGSSGIGYAIAEAFIADDCAVSLLAHDEEVHRAADQLRIRGGTVLSSTVADITNRPMVVEAFAKFGRIDVLVNNAGIEPITPLDDSDAAVDLFRRVIDVNLVGQHLCTLAALPHMERGASLLFTSSIWGKIGVAHYAAYCASKHGVLGYVRALSRELGPRGIAVNAVCPGQVLTPSVLAAFEDEARLTGQPSTSLMASARAEQAFDADLSAKDVAQVFVFLARQGHAVTGQAITVDMGGVQA